MQKGEVPWENFDDYYKLFSIINRFKIIQVSEDFIII